MASRDTIKRGQELISQIDQLETLHTLPSDQISVMVTCPGKGTICVASGPFDKQVALLSAIGQKRVIDFIIKTAQEEKKEVAKELTEL